MTTNQLAAELLSKSLSSCDAIYELATALKAFAGNCETEAQRNFQRELASKLFELSSDTRETEESTF